MISEIRNPYLRRAALVFTVVSIIVCVGPWRLIQATFRWVEDEFEADLVGTWKGTK